jgi:hypothetical protein
LTGSLPARAIGGWAGVVATRGRQFAEYVIFTRQIPRWLRSHGLDSEAVLTSALKVYKKENAMPRPAVDANNRVAFRVRAADKAIIMRAVALAQTDMTTFILRTALREAQSGTDL